MITPNQILQAIIPLYPKAAERFYCDFKGRDVSRMREIAAVLMRDHTELTYKQMAKELQRADHTTIGAAITRANGKYGKDEEFTAALELAKYNLRVLCANEAEKVPPLG